MTILRKYAQTKQITKLFAFFFVFFLLFSSRSDENILRFRTFFLAHSSDWRFNGNSECATHYLMDVYICLHSQNIQGDRQFHELYTDKHEVIVHIFEWINNAHFYALHLGEHVHFELVDDHFYQMLALINWMEQCAFQMFVKFITHYLGHADKIEFWLSMEFVGHFKMRIEFVSLFSVVNSLIDFHSK